MKAIHRPYSRSHASRAREVGEIENDNGGSRDAPRGPSHAQRLADQPLRALHPPLTPPQHHQFHPRHQRGCWHPADNSPGSGAFKYRNTHASSPSHLCHISLLYFDYTLYRRISTHRTLYIAPIKTCAFSSGSSTCPGWTGVHLEKVLYLSPSLMPRSRYCVWLTASRVRHLPTDAGCAGYT
ncbi:hypothetical protein BJV74DRAFT_856457 [Russula compacta]|nr:hypothetical protein BJV74DRAFT_856457 [Russula compacta]